MPPPLSQHDSLQLRNRMAVMEEMREPVFILDLGGCFTYLNPAACDATGRADLVGEPIEAIADPTHLDDCRVMREVLGTGRPWEGRLHHSHRGCAGWAAEASLSPIRDEQGRLVRYLLLERDTVEVRALRDQLAHAQRLELVGRLAGGVAHDFNNLLTIIQSSLWILREEPDLSADAHELIGEIDDASKRAAALTRQLLAFSRQQVLRPQLLDLNEVLRGMHKILTRLLGEDITLDIALEPSPTWIWADPGQVEQVLLNLVVNARDAMSGGGTLRLSTGRDNLIDAPLHIPPGWKGRGAWMAVCDEGTGIPPEVLPHIFDPFFTTKAAGEGTGLGLSMVQGIVSQSGGKVVVASRPRGGTCFRVVFPEADPDHPGVVRGATAPAAQRAAPCHLLLVEDEDPVRAVAARVLRAEGHTVSEARGLAEAMALVERECERYQAVLTDVLLEDGSGVDLAEHLQRCCPQLPVLFISGHPDERLRQLGLDADALHFLPKPYTPAQLLSALAALVGAGSG